MSLSKFSVFQAQRKLKVRSQFQIWQKLQRANFMRQQDVHSRLAQKLKSQCSGHVSRMIFKGLFGYQLYILVEINLPSISFNLIPLLSATEVLCSHFHSSFTVLTSKDSDLLILSFIMLSFGEGNGNPLQYSCLKNPMDGGAWQAAVHGVAQSQTRLSDFTFSFHFHALEKEMATYSSILAWRIPGTEPGGLQSMGLHRVGHD